MQAKLILRSQSGVVLSTGLAHGVTVYAVSCQRVAGTQVFHNADQALACYLAELARIQHAPDAVRR